MGSRKILVYGGKGALGSALVNYFKAKAFWIASVDFGGNEEADMNVVLQPNLGLDEQAKLVKAAFPEGTQLDGIFCVAGGWAGGNAASADFIKNADLMLQQSVWSSYIAASLAATFLKTDGILVLTGAQPALTPTPGMIAYGVAKAAVHHLVQSLGQPKGGLPTGGKALAILPVTLDTPMNRKWMKYAESWTPLLHVAELLNKWVEQTDLPANGSLVQLITKGGVTSTVIQ